MKTGKSLKPIIHLTFNFVRCIYTIISPFPLRMTQTRSPVEGLGVWDGIAVFASRLAVSERVQSLRGVQ